MSFDARHRYIINKIREVFEIADGLVVDTFLSNAAVLPLINIFLRGEGAGKLLVACRWHGDGDGYEEHQGHDDTKSHASGDYDGYL